MRGEGLIIFHTVDFKRVFVILRSGGTGPVQEFIPVVRLCDQYDIITAVDRKARLRIIAQHIVFAIYIGSTSVGRIGDSPDEVLVIDKDRGIGLGAFEFLYRKFRNLTDCFPVFIHPLFKPVRGVVCGSGGQGKRIPDRSTVGCGSGDVTILIHLHFTITGRGRFDRHLSITRKMRGIGFIIPDVQKFKIRRGQSCSGRIGPEQEAISLFRFGPDKRIRTVLYFIFTQCRKRTFIGSDIYFAIRRRIGSYADLVLRFFKLRDIGHVFTDGGRCIRIGCGNRTVSSHPLHKPISVLQTRESLERDRCLGIEIQLGGVSVLCGCNRRIAAAQSNLIESGVPVRFHRLRFSGNRKLCLCENKIQPDIFLDPIQGKHRRIKAVLDSVHGGIVHILEFISFIRNDFHRLLCIVLNISQSGFHISARCGRNGCDIDRMYSFTENRLKGDHAGDLDRKRSLLRSHQFSGLFIKPFPMVKLIPVIRGSTDIAGK